MFAGLMSRWMIPFEWAASSASASSIATPRIVSNFQGSTTESEFQSYEATEFGVLSLVNDVVRSQTKIHSHGTSIVGSIGLQKHGCFFLRGSTQIVIKAHLIQKCGEFLSHIGIENVLVDLLTLLLINLRRIHPRQVIEDGIHSESHRRSRRLPFLPVQHQLFPLQGFQ
jgi:hypothetical protein